MKGLNSHLFYGTSQVMKSQLHVRDTDSNYKLLCKSVCVEKAFSSVKSWFIQWIHNGITGTTNQ